VYEVEDTYTVDDVVVPTETETPEVETLAAIPN
jgi:hypothetical protein